MREREYEPKLILLSVKSSGDSLIVKLGADDPSDLDSLFADRRAKAEARKKGFKFADGRSDIQVQGQSRLSDRSYYYRKEQ